MVSVYENFDYKNEIVLILTGNEINKLNKNKVIKKLKIKYIILEKKFFDKEIPFFKGKIFLLKFCENPLLIAGIFLKKSST